MFVVRFQQLDRLHADSEKRFAERLVGHLKAHFPACDDETMARASITKGREYGLRSERDLFLFADLVCTVGLDFASSAQHAWLAAVLEDTAVTDPSARLRGALAALVSRLEIAAANRATKDAFLGGR